MSSLELCGEHIRLVSVGGHVDRALVNALLFFALNDQLGSAMDERYDRELLFGDRFLDLSRVLVPGGALKLEAEDVGTIITARENTGNFGVPVESLLDVGLDVEFVETLSSLLGADLLDGGQEGVGLVETVQEADSLVDGGGVILPDVEHLETLLHVVEPGVEATGRHPRFLLPLGGNPVELDVLHEHLHSSRHGKLSLERQVKVLEIGRDLLDEGVDQFALLQVDVLVRSTLIVGEFRVDFVNG